jgi:hypothetical protein
VDEKWRLRSHQARGAAGMICTDRTSSNPENTVGVLTMAGRGVDLLVSPTEDAGKILACFTRVSTGGKTDFSSAVQIAQLALKHRKNKNGGQRIVVFVGSPIAEGIPALQKIGKQLKKNNVAVDVISFGELTENNEKLIEFINSTNSNDNWYVISMKLRRQFVSIFFSFYKNSYLYFSIIVLVLILQIITRTLILFFFIPLVVEDFFNAIVITIIAIINSVIIIVITVLHICHYPNFFI